MKHQLTNIIISLVAISFGSKVSAQQLLDRIDVTLSPTELTFKSQHNDIDLKSEKELFENPAYTNYIVTSDTTTSRFSSIVYGGLSGASSRGDFLPYQGNGSTDYRTGAYATYSTPTSGTLAGNINYSRGIHRRIGWSAMRQPQLYLPYISTDSIGGDFHFESYHVDGSYSIGIGKQWTLGGRMAFTGEQAYRTTDPRALTNTTWLRFSLGAVRNFNRHKLLIDAGYARNKQHVQLRYWRPGQQDRFFVCYGFGLYDVRQSAVLFGKSRMYYVDQFSARIQYLSPQIQPLRLHASIAYSFCNMQTEESDIYNLYESKTHTIQPQVLLTFSPNSLWTVSLHASSDILLRRGYENIIEEYLIDKANNIYDFRTIDTQQNYSYSQSSTTAALRLARQLGSFALSLQAGVTAFSRQEKYSVGSYMIENSALTPHVKIGFSHACKKSEISIAALCGRQHPRKHTYDVDIQNQDIQHLDFQHAFTPYAYYASRFRFSTLSLTYKHNLKRMTAGVSCKLYVSNGNRLADVAYSGNVGFPSSAPTISKLPDEHDEKWGAITFFLSF